MKKIINISLAGNPNTGKTSIFNALTGQHQHVGNWPGVTVEKKEGTIFEDDINIVNLVDLPGIYSLRASSQDEVVASDFLIKKHPDMTLVILDASRLERSLYLYMQIKELGQKTVVALNMIDLAKANGIKIDLVKLSQLLGCPVIETIGNTQQNINALKHAILETLHEDQKIISTTFRNSVEESIQIIKNNILYIDEEISKENLAIKIAEKDNYFYSKLQNKEQIMEILNTQNNKLKSNNLSDLQTEIIEDRWNTIRNIYLQVVSKVSLKKTSDIIEEKLDKIFTHKIFGLPIFFLIMFLMFFCVFNIGDPIAGYLELLIELISTYSANILDNVNASPLLKSFIIDGILGGVGTVIVFLPNIFILFFLLSILEDTGYLSRGTFVMDRLMNAIGLHGKSFIPLIMGFGCSIPAIIGTRIMERKRDRIITMLITPFISCSAKLPVFVLFTGAFFKSKASLVLFSLYMIGIVISIIIAKILSITLFKGERSILVMELPSYHIPIIKTSIESAWRKSYEFLERATTFIMMTVLIIWLLGTLPLGVEYASEESIIGIIGNKISFIFKFAGYGFWQAGVALITGILAKEAIVGTLGTLGITEELVFNYFTSVSAYSYLLMVLLYTPCLAAVAAFKKETNSWKWTIFLSVYSFLVALLVSTLFYQIMSRIL